MKAFLIGIAALRLVTTPGVARTGPSPATRVETYRSAEIDANGNLTIARPAGRSIVVRTKDEQTSFWAPVVSSAGTAVAAETLFPNCCTSYDIPLQLVVYARGKVHRFKGAGLGVTSPCDALGLAAKGPSDPSSAVLPHGNPDIFRR